MKIRFDNALLLNGTTSETGSLLVDGAVIAAIGTSAQNASADRVIDAKGAILMPALFNAHTHAAMTLLRGHGSDLPLSRWLTEKIFPAEEKLTPDSVYWGTMLALCEMFRFGCVGFADAYYFMHEACRATIEAGGKICASWDSSLENQAGLLHTFGDQKDNVRIFGGIHAEYTTDENYVRTIADFCNENKLPLQVHVAETKSETEGCIARHSMSPMAYFAKIGAFDHGGIAAHCVYFDGEDYDLAREKNVWVAHNPVSNLKLASGRMPIERVFEKGVGLTLGTDGCASNNNLNLFEEIKLTATLHKGITQEPCLAAPKQIFVMATQNGARACGFANSGKLEVGAAADLILLSLDGPHATCMTDPYAHIAYSAQGSDVCLTMTNGRIVYENGMYPTVDYEKTRAMAQIEAKKLLA